MLNKDLKNKTREFPSDLLVRTRCFHSQSQVLIPGRGTEIPQAARRSQKRKKPFPKKAKQNLQQLQIFSSLY